MKTIKIYSKFILTCHILFMTVSYSNSQSGWILRSTAANINSVFFINSTNGWCVGDSGLTFVTYDGGVSWSGLNSNTSSKLNSVFFRDDLTGWAAGSNGTVIKTSNGGLNWTVIPTGVTWNITSIHFPVPDTGYAYGDYSMKSTDGGNTFTADIFSFLSRSAQFISAKTGFYVSSSNIFKTTNGGSHWFTTILTGSYNSVYFLNSSTGWTSGNGIRYTTNTGVNWTVQSAGAGFSTLYGIHFYDGSNGWSVGSLGTVGGNSEIRRTSNAGINWSGQSSGTTNILRSVAAVSSSNGVTVGDAGTILMTTNSGTNWSGMLNTFSYPSNQSFNLNAVHFINNSTGWSGGQSGVINRTTDAGNSWTSFLTGSFNSINTIHFIDKDTGWIGGAGGMIQTSNNAGNNWTSQTTGASNSVNDIDINKFTLTGFLGLYKIGWCVTNNGGIYKTTNGGFDWISQLSPTTAHLYSVKGFSENVAIACGDSGKILKTTDGGTSWGTFVTGAVNGALRSLAFADENYGICVGDSATVLYTTNKGDTWTPDYTGPGSLTKKNLFNVSARMPAMAEYIAVGEGGVILKTDDEGVSWNLLESGVKTKLSGISSPSDGISFVTGTKGTILKTTDGGVLPVELISFDFYLDNRNVNLQWSTSNELNNHGFDIERRSSENSWNKIGFVEGKGTTSNRTDYNYSDNNLSAGKYNYRIKQIDFNGNFEYFNLNSEIVIGNPSVYMLHQNFPNPFNPSTTIKFEIPEFSKVSIGIYDILGKEIVTLLNDFKEPGSYKVNFSAENISSGVYFYTLESVGVRLVKKLIVLK